MRMERVGGREARNEPRDRVVLEFDGRLIPTDEEGYLLHTTDWSAELASHMAAQDGVELGDDHWILIDFLNRFYSEFEIAPDLPILARNLCKDQQECRWSRRYVNELFPDGARMACRYAGLPKPLRSCL